MNKDIIPFLMDMARLVPGVDIGAALARGVQGRASGSDALALLPFLGWAKKAKKGSALGRSLLRAANKVDEPAELGAQALKAAERQWAEGLGGLRRAAPPLPMARRGAHEVGELGVPFFQQYAGSRAENRLAEEMFRNMERLK